MKWRGSQRAPLEALPSPEHHSTDPELQTNTRTTAYCIHLSTSLTTVQTVPALRQHSAPPVVMGRGLWKMMGWSRANKRHNGPLTAGPGSAHYHGINLISCIHPHTLCTSDTSHLYLVLQSENETCLTCWAYLTPEWCGPKVWSYAYMKDKTKSVVM